MTGWIFYVKIYFFIMLSQKNTVSFILLNKLVCVQSTNKPSTTIKNIYLTKGKISENQNQLQNFTITVTEFKNSVSGLNIRLDVAEERISELKDWSGKKYI